MATDRQLAEDFMRLRPQHTSDAATHRALMLRYDLTSEPSVRSRVYRGLRQIGQPEPALTLVEKPAPHKTLSFTDYVSDSDSLLPADDADKIFALLRALRSYDRHVRVLILSDEHFDDHDERAITMNIRVAAYAQPDLIVLNGDSFDFSAISSYPKDRRDKGGDVLSTLRKPYGAYIRALNAAAPSTPILFIDGNHNERLEAFTNANAVPFGDTIEQAYADLVRQGGRVLWYDGMQELDILNHHVMHGERAGKSAANATMEDDFGGAQSISAGHIHGIQKVYKRVKLPGSSRWVIVTSCFAGFAGNNPPAYVKRKRDQIHWIQACQLVTVNPHGDDVHINEIPFHEAADGGLIAVVGIEVLTVAATAASGERADAAA